MEPRRAAPRRVRLVVRRPARLGPRPGAARHRRQPQRAAPEPRAPRRCTRRSRAPASRPRRSTSRPTAAATATSRRSRASRRCTGPSGSSSTASTSPTGPGAPIAFLNRSLGSIDAYAASIGRWLVTRDGFDLLVHYLPDYDYASHALGPDAAHEALARADAAIAALFDAAGGPDEFLDRYAVVLCSDHGQSPSRRPRGSTCPGGLVTASNRAGDDLRRRSRGASPRRSTASRPSTSRSSSRTARWSRAADGDDDPRILDDYPDGRARAEAALRNPNAGEVLVSAAPGYEFADLGGRHHVGGGSHGSLAAADSEVPMLTVGLGEPPASITGIKGAAARRTSESAVAAERPPDGRDRRLPGSTGSSRAAGSTTSACSRRWRACRASSSSPRSSARRAYDDAPVPLPYGQTISQPYMVALTCEALGLDGDETRARRRAPAPATRPRCSPSSPPRCTRSSGSPSWPTRPGRRSPPPATSGSQVHVGDGCARAPGARAVRRDRGRRGGAGGAAGALGSSSREGGRIALPLATGRRAQHLCVLERTPHGPRLLASVPARYVPLVHGQSLTRTAGRRC